MGYHKNFYNVEIQHEDGLLLYNILTKNFVLLEREYEEFYKKFPKVDDEKKLQEFLDAGFIVDNKFDEKGYYLRNFFMSRYYSRKLLFTVVPTTACNFACYYCFESGIKTVKITQELKEKIFKFIKERIELFKPEEVSLSFYGGEPLLFKDELLEFARFFKSLSEDFGFKFSSDIVTNGYLFDVETARKLIEEASLKSAQITLDGPPEIHDKRRFLKNGNGTFDRIFENVKNVIEAFHQFVVRIRVNVDKLNIDYIEELLKLLASIKRDNLEVYFSPVTGEKDKMDSSENLFTDEEYGKVYAEKIVPLLYKYGFPYEVYPELSYVFCAGITPFHYLIDGDGTIKKCFDLVGRDKESVGNVDNYREDSRSVLKWENLKILDKECYNCKFLPICGGGCPLYKLKTGKNRCEMWRYNLENLLKTIYDLKEHSLARG
jgi:uncharacterized protein